MTLHLTLLDYLAAGAAGGVAGAVNAIAGGGTLVSFSALVGIGLPAVAANVTNTVALVPAYLSGSWGQRADLGPQLRLAKVLAAAALLGGLSGSVLLVAIPAAVFRIAAPYLILLACALLLGEDRLRKVISPTRVSAARVNASGNKTLTKGEDEHSWGLFATGAVFLAAVYGGFFGAGLGIMLMAVLGIFSTEPLLQVNALKQALSFVVNLMAAGFFVFSGRVTWVLIPVMSVTGVLGGTLGSRLVHVINPVILRTLVVVAGIGVALALWVAS